MIPKINVYVPKVGTSSRGFVKPGSAVVGITPEPGSETYVVVDYEGNIYNAKNMRSFHEKVSHAADRHIARYPTMARMTVGRDTLITVGSAYILDEWYAGFEPNDDPEAKVALEEWLGDGFEELKELYE